MIEVTTRTERWELIEPFATARDCVTHVPVVVAQLTDNKGVRGWAEAAGVDYAPVPPRYRTTYFSHVFSGGYSAGYYGYLWSERLDADTVEWFKENGGMLRKNGDYFRKMLLSKGGTVDAMQMYRAFRGRDAEIGPLLERRGLTAQ